MGAFRKTPTLQLRLILAISFVDTLPGIGGEESGEAAGVPKTALSNDLPHNIKLGEVWEELRALRAQGMEQNKELQALRAEQLDLRRRLNSCGCNITKDDIHVASEESFLDGKTSLSEEHVAFEVASRESSHVLHVDIHDEAWIKEVFFGGQPWILHCLNSDSSVSQEVPDVIVESAYELRSFATFGTVSCWERLASSQKTLAQRFGLPKPPVALAVANGDPPVVLDLSAVVRPSDLKDLAASHLKVKITHISGLSSFKALCTKRSACLVIGYRAAKTLRAASKALAPFLGERRALRTVALDTSVWTFRLDDRLVRKRPVVGSDRADILCIAKGEAPPPLANKRLARDSPIVSARDGSRGGSWFPAGEFFPKAVAAFMQRCEEGKDLLPLLDIPWISHRKQAERPAPSVPKRPSKRKGFSETHSTRRQSTTSKSAPRGAAVPPKKGPHLNTMGGHIDEDGYEHVEL